MFQAFWGNEGAFVNTSAYEDVETSSYCLLAKPVYFLDMETAFRKMGIQELGLRLYGGDEAIRLTQEIVLGISGMRLLLKMGIHPGVIHHNEGHCAFATLEYARYWRLHRLQGSQDSQPLV